MNSDKPERPNTLASLLNTAQLLREKDAAALLAVAPKTMRSWRTAGGQRGPPYIKICGAVRYEVSDLLVFIQTRRRMSTSQ